LKTMKTIKCKPLRKNYRLNRKRIQIIPMAFLLLLFCGMSNQSFAQGADVVGLPSVVNAEVGNNYTVVFQIDASTQEVSVAELFLSFNQNLIQVNSVSSASGNPLISTLPSPLPGGVDFDNATGQIYFGRFTLPPAANTLFDFIEVNFTAIATGTTQIDYITSGFPKTSLSFAGFDVTGTLNPITINITAVVVDCPELGVNNGDPCVTTLGEDGEYVNCECLPFDCEGIAGGSSDEQLWFNDSDDDGFGDPNDFLLACDAPTGYVGNNLDCNDNLAVVNPNAPEICDGVDNDCDGLTDDDDPDVTGQSIWYADNDGDGFGAGPQILSCNQPSKTSDNNFDCYDTNMIINPNAQEVCDGVDNDCDGLTDDDDPDVTGQSIWYADNDGDSFGAGPQIHSCNQPPNTSDNNFDCDDTNMNINPNAQEVCDGVDNDCDGLTDDDDPDVTGQSVWYADNDDDGFGAGPQILACNQPANTSANNFDCDDSNSEINPNASEICDGIDNDCANGIDDGLIFITYYEDGDGDGFGDSNDAGEDLCEDPGDGRVTNNLDCDDSNNAVNPLAEEICDNIDNDCDGLIDADDDNIETCLDCAGVFNGTAFIDECGECVGGSTDLDPCVLGCTDALACNFDSEATEDDGSCIVPVENCLECNENNDGLVLIDDDDDGICNANDNGINGQTSWDTQCGSEAVTVSIYAPGNTTPLQQVSGTVSESGAFVVNFNITPGIYDVYIKVNGYLSKGFQAFEIQEGPNDLQVGELIKGDIANDDEINIQDFGIFSSNYGTDTGDSGFNPLADMDCDGDIDIADFAIFSSSYGEQGDEAAFLAE